MVQLRKEAVALPPVYGVPGVVAADPRLVEEGRKGVLLGAPESTGYAMVGKGGSHRGVDCVLGRHAGRLQGVVQEGFGG